MNRIEYSEIKVADLLKKLDFSNNRHKDQLWQSLLSKSVRPLDEDDLELIAAAGEGGGGFNKLCPHAEIIYHNNKAGCKNWPCKDCVRNNQ